jgi:hypothetical protein
VRYGSLAAKARDEATWEKKSNVRNGRMLSDSNQKILAKAYLQASAPLACWIGVMKSFPIVR